MSFACVPNVFFYRNYMNDSLRTNVFLRFNPESIACACLFLAARTMQIPLPNKPPWYEIFEVEFDTIKSICLTILQLYKRPKANFEKLEKVVDEAKKLQVEAKLKAKIGHGSQDGTPNSNSRANSPKVSTPSSLLSKKIKTEDRSRSHSENGSPEQKNGDSHKGKRRHDDSDRSRSRSRSHSRSRSYSRSRSRSMSPPLKKKKKRSYTPIRRHKKDKYYDDDDYYYSSKEKRSHKVKKRVRSHSRSPSFTPPRYTSSKSNKKYLKEKRRSYTPEKIHRSRKHRNGHRESSPSRDRSYSS